MLALNALIDIVKVPFMGWVVWCSLPLYSRANRNYSRISQLLHAHVILTPVAQWFLFSLLFNISSFDEWDDVTFVKFHPLIGPHVTQEWAIQVENNIEYDCHISYYQWLVLMSSSSIIWANNTLPCVPLSKTSEKGFVALFCTLFPL